MNSLIPSCWFKLHGTPDTEVMDDECVVVLVPVWSALAGRSVPTCSLRRQFETKQRPSYPVGIMFGGTRSQGGRDRSGTDTCQLELRMFPVLYVFMSSIIQEGSLWCIADGVPAGPGERLRLRVVFLAILQQIPQVTPQAFAPFLNPP